MNGGVCNTGERYRWQRARARIGCLSPGYILLATLHIVASVRAPCLTCSRPPCHVRMLYEPFTHHTSHITSHITEFWAKICWPRPEALRRSAESGSRVAIATLERPLVSCIFSGKRLLCASCPADELLSAAGCPRPATAALEHSSCTHAAHHAPPNAYLVDATAFWWLSHVPPGSSSRTATCEFHRGIAATHRAAA